MTSIVDGVAKCIREAAIVIGDLSGRNGNVLYELGQADALKKRVILLAQEVGDVPFNLQGRRVILYTLSTKGFRELQEEITATILSLFEPAEPPAARRA